MKLLKIGLSRPKKFKLFAELIRLIEKTEFSHAFILFENFYGEKVVFQASGSKVNFMNFEIFEKDNIITNLYDIEVENLDYENVISYCLKQVGKPYSIRDIVGITLYKITSLKLLKGTKEKEFICSELIGEILQIIEILEEKELDYFTPKNLYNLLESIDDII